MLFVSLHPGGTLDADAIREHLRGSLSKYKLPVEITIMHDLPKNPVGKIDKPTLRKRLVETPSETQSPSHSQRSAIMGFIKPNLPDVDPDTFMQKPLMERMRILTAELGGQRIRRRRGWCTPSTSSSWCFFYALGGIVVATLTSGLPAFWHVSQWWNQPIVYQKAILWTVLLEADRRRRIVGAAGRQDQADDRWHPVLGAAGHHPAAAVEVGAVDRGDRRTWFDVALYVVLMVSVVVPLFSPGVHSDSLSAALPANTSGLVNPALLIAPMVLLVLMGLRDKTVFLAARGEQYLPALFFFAALPFVDMIIALKLLIVVVWVGAGVSKLGLHFTNVIPPMVSNSPSIPFKWFKRAHYRNYPDDLRPSHLAELHGARPGHRRGNPGAR